MIDYSKKRKNKLKNEAEKNATTKNNVHQPIGKPSNVYALTSFFSLFFLFFE